MSTFSVAGSYWISCISGVLVDDLSGRDREVPADLELARVGLPDLERPAPALDVLGQKLHAAHEVFAIRSEGFAQEFRVGEHPVRRRDRIDDLLGVEPRLLLGVGIKSFDFARPGSLPSAR